MTKKIITNEDLILQLSQERQEKIAKEVEANVKKWGGIRKNSGRKSTVTGKLLKFTKRLTDEEVKFINYAREHNINYNDLMQG